MIIYSENRYVPTDVNMMVIRGKDNEGFLYMHRSLYDQAVIIHDIYSEDFTQLAVALTGKSDMRDDVVMFMDKAPVPVNALGPFLLLIENELESFEDMVGALHVMSGPVNLRKMLKVPFDMRNTPSFSLSIKEEYQLAWDRFFQNAIPYSDDMFLGVGTRPMNGTNTTTEPAQESLSNIGDDGVEYDDPLSALLFGCSSDIFDVPEEDEEDEQSLGSPSVNVTVQPAPVNVTVVPAPAQNNIINNYSEEVDDVPDTEEVVEEPKTGLDFLANGGI